MSGALGSGHGLNAVVALLQPFANTETTRIMKATLSTQLFFIHDSFRAKYSIWQKRSLAPRA
jgi:hypothetical protein